MPEIKEENIQLFQKKLLEWFESNGSILIGGNKAYLPTNL